MVWRKRSRAETPADITQAVSALQTASNYVNDQTGFYGAAENNITSALDLAQKFQTQDQTQLSGLEDADAAASRSK